jgi:hypothetical protein
VTLFRCRAGDGRNCSLWKVRLEKVENGLNLKKLVKKAGSALKLSNVLSLMITWGDNEWV